LSGCAGAGPDEQVGSLRLDRVGVFVRIARIATRSARDHAATLSGADPEMPPLLYNRVADNWRPLFAVADAAGAEWPERARQAACKLIADGATDESSMRAMLLADLRQLFDAEPSGVPAACRAARDSAELSLPWA
jgi:hypothetical protein